jgi:uncharacterized protein (TIGR03435 family)
MKREQQTNSAEDVLAEAGDSLREWAPSPDEERGALDRVWNGLRWKARHVPADAVRSVKLGSQVPELPRVLGVPRVLGSPDRRSIVRAAAAALVIVAVGGAMVWPRGVRVYAAGNDGLQVTLADDSRVEMRAHSEMVVGRASDGIQIDLKTGDIIVTAAEQRGGRLSVRTKDMTVALSNVAPGAKVDVAGTVFLVNTGTDGSRVGVIEGEVRVRERNGETRLRPGQQVATSPTIGRRPLTEDITWSRNADAHLAILDSFKKGMEQTAGTLAPVATPRPPAAVGGQAASTGFEEASIRACDPENLPATPTGARGGGPNSLLMTPGHLYAQCVTLATLIRTALEYGPVDLELLGGAGRRAERGMRLEAVYGLGVEDGRRVRGGPDWIRTDRYTIEAVGDARATAEMMRGPMLRDLLERRFQLKAHIEAEQIPAYALVVGPGGLKGMKPFRDSDCSQEVSDSVKAERARKGWTGPLLMTEAAYFGVKPNCGGGYGETNGPNFHIEFANSTPGALAGTIGGSIGVRVIDRTNITDRFTFTWDFGIDEQTPRALEQLQRGKTWNPKPGWDSPMTIPKAPSIFAAVEELGLKLEPIRVPREFIVVDRVERPSPN